MSQRKKNVLLSIAALAFGCLLYVVFRPHTYIGVALGRWEWVNTIRQICSIYASDLCKFYLPDFLWGVSLGSGLIAAHDPGKKGVVTGAAIAFVCGVAWEFLQYLKVIDGTADMHDIIMYTLASVLCIFINLKEKRK